LDSVNDIASKRSVLSTWRDLELAKANILWKVATMTNEEVVTAYDVLMTLVDKLESLDDELRS
jgi:hypothetical protein